MCEENGSIQKVDLIFVIGESEYFSQLGNGYNIIRS